MARTKPLLAVVVALAVSVGTLWAFFAPVATASHESIRISSPEGTYFVGQAVNVSGTANATTDSVAVYASGGGDWQLLDVNRDGELDGDDRVPVDERGNWSVRNLVLSNASRVLSYPGSYRIGVVNATAVGGNGTLPSSIDPARFVETEGGQTPIRVNRARLRGSFRTVASQVATSNAEVTVRGTARGGRELLVVLVDSRGRVGTDRITVPRGNGSFDADVPLRTVDGRPFAEGPVRAYVLALGRDDVPGDGRLPDGANATLDSLAEYVAGSTARLDARQVSERFLDQTVDEAGSDDLLIAEQFDYVDPTTRITTVATESQFVPGRIYSITAGERMVVAGRTNLFPGENTIRIEAVDGPSAGRLPPVWTHDWNADGNWSVAMDTDGLEPGVYTLVVEAEGETDDQVSFSVTRRAGNVTPD
ncbi:MULTISPECIES: hypothetical protein [Halorussus]|uniref:hypothetical protein n=1 Tax=Halorussus TaxID=1070314 RepID=UPI000E20EBB0|nr:MULTISPECIES: hypothetical protein [Halorussus]NHN59312.1 hypothetical protein [Halorussus sp. JP-T4]